MKDQQQERAEKYADTFDCIDTYAGVNGKTKKDIAIEFFIAGENSGSEIGRRMEREEISAKASEGLEEWAEFLSNDFVGYSYSKQAWQAGRAPLLAKIEQYQKESEIDEQNIHLLLDRFTTLEAQLHQAKAEWSEERKRSAELEAQNKKLGDVVLETEKYIQEALRYNGDTTKVEQVLKPLLLSSTVKQLKQERGE